MQILESLLNKFQKYNNSNAYPWHWLHDGEEYNFQLQLNGIIHGNETGSLPALLQIIEEIETKKRYFGGKISIILGNPEAAKLDRRFVEKDLNRLFLSQKDRSHEGKRARILMPIFRQADLLIDLHQTILPSNEAFYIFPNQKESLNWARALEVTRFYVDATPSRTEAPRYQCADEFAWRNDIPAITIELGQKGIREETTRRAYRAIDRALTIIEEIHSETLSIEYISSQAPELEHYQTTHREPYSSSNLELRPNLINFTAIQKGENLAASGSPVLLAPHDGMLLFPKYPRRKNGQICEALPKEIYRIISKI